MFQIFKLNSLFYFLLLFSTALLLARPSDGRLLNENKGSTKICGTESGHLLTRFDSTLLFSFRFCVSILYEQSEQRERTLCTNYYAVSYNKYTIRFRFIHPLLYVHPKHTSHSTKNTRNTKYSRIRFNDLIRFV